MYQETKKLNWSNKMQQQSYGTNNQQQLYILPLIFAWLHNLNSLSDIIFLLVNKVAKKSSVVVWRKILITKRSVKIAWPN